MASRKMEISQITISGIEIEVHRKPIKNMNIRVYPANREVRISVPYYIRNSAIEHFVASKLPWIQKHLANFKRVPAKLEPKFLTGESHSFWGRDYELKVIEQKTSPCVVLKDEFIELYVRNGKHQRKTSYCFRRMVSRRD